MEKFRRLNIFGIPFLYRLKVNTDFSKKWVKITLRAVNKKNEVRARVQVSFFSVRHWIWTSDLWIDSRVQGPILLAFAILSNFLQFPSTPPSLAYLLPEETEGGRLPPHRRADTLLVLSFSCLPPFLGGGLFYRQCRHTHSRLGRIFVNRCHLSRGSLGWISRSSGSRSVSRVPTERGATLQNGIALVQDDTLLVAPGDSKWMLCGSSSSNLRKSQIFTTFFLLLRGSQR